jgi:hypothetical protein
VTVPVLVGISLPIFFVALWLFVTAMLGLVSGWFALARRYPDQPEAAILTMRYQLGVMGPSVRLNGVLWFSTCSSGLRIAILRLFGPFSRDFFVPWNEISIVRQDAWLAGSQVELRFGSTGRLRIPAFIADKLAASVPKQWPEKMSSEL